MNREIFSFDLNSLNEDDKRLLLSASLVFFMLSFTIAHLFTKNMLWRLLGTDSNIVDMKLNGENQKVYEVLLEQENANKDKKDEIKALSNEDSAGSGGLTEKEGFHTNSPFYEFIYGGLPSSASQMTQKTSDSKKTEDEVYEIGIYQNDPLMKMTPQNTSASNATMGKETKIPFNYRFQQDFLFRWDGSSSLSIPSKKLAGYAYFKHMIKQIEEGFAAPGGGNIAYRDQAGFFIREGINPGESRVSFMLNEEGQVIDVKQVTSQGQDIVDRACLDSLRGQNFGPVPPEVKEQGMIFGINFVFPGHIRYR